MTRTEAIARIAATLPKLSDERIETLAELAEGWTDDSVLPPEDESTRAAIGRGVAQARRGEFATDEEIDAAYARFRK